MTTVTNDMQQRGDGYLVSLMLSADGIGDPAPWYRKLREEMPVFESASGAVFLSRYHDCRSVLRDNRFGKAESSAGDSVLAVELTDEMRAFRQEQAKRRREGPGSMLFMNPPDHTRLRGLVSRAFTPRRIEAMRASIAVLADECMRDLAARGEADAIEVLGWVPVNVISELIGVPRQDWAGFRDLVTRSAIAVEPTATLDQLEDAEAAFREMWSYFEDLVARRRSAPRHDLVSALAEVEEAGDRLSEAELISTAILLYAAGMETTQNLIGNGLGALFANPAQMDELWRDPTLVASAVEEMLRWDSPVQIDGRAVLEETSVAGLRLAPGRRVVTMLGAANRDPAQFSDPDTFDVTRKEGPPLSFASGIHYCLGANLARAEAQEVFSGLVKWFSSVEPAGELRHRSRMTLRGYECVPVRVQAR